MEELLKMGLSVYEAAGIIGLSIIIIAILVILLLRTQSHRIRAMQRTVIAQEEIVSKFQKQLNEKMEETLDRCEESCRKKDEIINQQQLQIEELRRKNEVHARNEVWFRNEIENLEIRIADLEKNDDIRETRSKRKIRRRPET